MVITGDVMGVLPTLDAESVQCCVTSPPYYGLRNYQVDGQLGLEATYLVYVEKMVRVFREVWRVLRNDGTLWLNLGDSYASGKETCFNPGGNTSSFNTHLEAQNVYPLDRGNKSTLEAVGLKPKDLCGIPWRVAFALQADGWYLRQDIIWAKPNPMPESVTDRCTKSHEYIFLLTKSARYFYDCDAIREKMGNEMSTDEYAAKTAPGATWQSGGITKYAGANKHDGGQSHPNGRNRRSVWTITTKPFKEAHFATFPPEIPEICIKAGTSEKGCCPECGSPWERVVERVSTGKSYSVGKSKEKNEAGLVTGFSGYDDGSSAPVFKTTGWRPTCTHGIFTCNTCHIVLEYSNNTIKEVSNNEERFKEKSTSNSILSELSEGISDRSLRCEIPSVLHKGLCCEVDDQETEQSRKDNDATGIYSCYEKRTSVCMEGRICDGTPSRDGKTYREDSNQTGGCSSHQRSYNGQPDRKSCFVQEDGSRPYTKKSSAKKDKLSPLRKRDNGSVECPICGGEGEIEPFAPQPCVVLDCFSGAGTTGLVAEKLGRKYIGIELNPSYVAMSEKRIYDEVGGLLEGVR